MRGNFNLTNPNWKYLTKKSPLESFIRTIKESFLNKSRVINRDLKSKLQAILFKRKIPKKRLYAFKTETLNFMNLEIFHS